MKTTALVFAFLMMSTTSWATNLWLKGSRVSQVFNENGMTWTSVTVFERHLISGAPLKNPSYCYNPGNGSYELRLPLAHPQFKEIYAAMLASSLTAQVFDVTTENESCNIKGFGVRDQ